MSVPKLIVNMSVPLMLSLLVQSLYNIVDSIFVARLSESALTATSLAYPIQILMVAFSVGTAVGVNAILSKRLGEKRYEEASLIASTGLTLALIGALAFTLLGLFFAKPLAFSFTADEQIATLCGEYLFICMLFCAGTFIETMFQRFLQAAGYTFYSMISLVVGALTNIILDPIMIFGLGPFPALGIRGAATATVIGQWLGALTAFLLNKFKNPTVKLKLKGFRLKGNVVAQIYKVGLPTIVTQASGCAMVALMNNILISFSSTAVAFFGVYYKLQNFLFMPLNGLGQAAIPIVGFNYGARERKRISDTVRIMLPLAIAFAFLGTLIFCLFPSQLLSLFSAGEEMLELGVPALRTISLTFVFAAVTLILGYLISGLGNGIVNMLGTLIRQLILLIPSAYIFANFFGVTKVWYAMWISEFVAVLYAVVHSLLFYRKKIKTI